MSNVRAMQSVAMSAVMAMLGWLLIAQHGSGSALRVDVAGAAPATQALTRAPVNWVIEPMPIGLPVQDSVAAGGRVYYSLITPADSHGLRISLLPHTGDADLYVRAGQAPVGDIALGGLFDASSAGQGVQREQISLSDSGNQEWFIAVHGFEATQFQLTASLQ